MAATPPDTPQSPPSSASGWLHFFSRPSPLQDATVWFVLVNCLDVFMTYILIRFGAIESNPVANYFLQTYGFAAMIYFKMAIVAFVCIVIHILAWQNLRVATRLIWVGTLIVAVVVVYSAGLFAQHFILGVEHGQQL